jgi:hypothetical protein
MVCCVGAVLNGHEKLVARLKAQGAFVLGRFATEEEIESAYFFSDAIWCCYPPEEDQASGVFGRAIQFGCPAWVRANSNIARLADWGELPSTKISFGQTTELAAALAKLQRGTKKKAKNVISEKTRQTLLQWRLQFMNAIKNCL